MILEGKVKSTFDWFSERAIELDSQAAKNGGTLPRHDIWRVEYYKNPYLLLESDETILERFADIFTNGMDLSVEGKITVTPMMEQNGRLSRFFTEIIEETNWRGILHSGSMPEVMEQLNAYFEDGTPLGVRMFASMPRVQKNCLFKFSKKEFVEDMYKYGRFRISPASYYSKGSLLRAVKDLETKRHYRLQAINEAIQGLNHIEFNGHQFNIVNGVVPIDFIVGDYYLFSSCGELSRRMPTDFEADSVLIIKNKTEFITRLKNRLLIYYPEWEFVEGDVYYFDSYNDLPIDRNQEFYKHISYSYQKEHRCIVRPRPGNDENLSPFFIELGALDDICDVISL